MKIELGVKTDPIEYRYSFDWLFETLRLHSIRFVQLGSFFELYWVEDDYFHRLRETAETFGIRIKSCFTAHRELGGFLTGDPFLEKAARNAYERFIHVASIVGADYMGSNPGAVYRDRIEGKRHGTRCYLNHMKELSAVAYEKGLKALTIEPMSCLAEPPSLPEEIDEMMGELADHHAMNPGGTTPVFLCGDISHGVFDRQRQKIHDHYDLFAYEIPHMAEFHFKNTDDYYQTTFGFSPEECKHGVVDLKKLKNLIESRGTQWPVEDVVGYLELTGPKLGRDYSDPELLSLMTTSIAALKEAFAD